MSSVLHLELHCRLWSGICVGSAHVSLPYSLRISLTVLATPGEVPYYYLLGVERFRKESILITITVDVSSCSGSLMCTPRAVS